MMAERGPCVGWGGDGLMGSYLLREGGWILGEAALDWGAPPGQRPSGGAFCGVLCHFGEVTETLWAAFPWQRRTDSSLRPLQTEVSLQTSSRECHEGCL